MGPPSYMRSVVDLNVVMRRMTVLTSVLDGGERCTKHLCRCTPWKDPQNPLNRRLGGPQNLPGRFDEGKYFLPLPEFESCIITPLAQLLYRLRYSGSGRCVIVA